MASEIITVMVAETISNNSAVHIDGAGEAYKAVLPDRPATGFCKSGAASGLIQVFLSGIISVPLEAFNGTFVYLDNDTPGDVTATKPAGDFQVIGRMVDNGLMIEPSQTQITTLNAAAVASFI